MLAFEKTTNEIGYRIIKYEERYTYQDRYNDNHKDIIYSFRHHIVESVGLEPTSMTFTPNYLHTYPQFSAFYQRYCGQHR